MMYVLRNNYIPLAQRKVSSQTLRFTEGLARETTSLDSLSKRERVWSTIDSRPRGGLLSMGQLPI